VYRRAYTLRRQDALAGLGLLVAGGCGLAAGKSPAIALAAAGAAALCAVVIADLAIGIVLFTLASYAAVLQLGGATTLSKLIGLLLVLSWIAAVSTGALRDHRELWSDQRSLVICAALLLGWSFLSAAWATSPSTAVAGAARYAQDLTLFPILYMGLRRVAHVRWVVVTFVCGALLSVIYSAIAGSTEGPRLSGALGDANETAAVLVAAGILALALGAGARKGSVVRWASLIAGAGALIGLGATASRGGLVALAVAALASIAVAGRSRGRMLVAVLLSAALVTGWFAVLASPGARAHITSADTSGRSTLWTVAVRSIETQPIVGLGNDNFQSSAKNFLLQPGATKDARLIVTSPHVAHNIYLEIWADLGIIGLALFLALVVLALRCAARAMRAFARAGRHREELLARALIIAVVGMLAADFFVSNVYSKQLWLLLALAPAQLAVARACEAGAERYGSPTNQNVRLK
jgi:putative inorganic carbon (HCO3(-)) transporter